MLSSRLTVLFGNNSLAKESFVHVLWNTIYVLKDICSANKACLDYHDILELKSKSYVKIPVSKIFNLSLIGLIKFIKIYSKNKYKDEKFFKSVLDFIGLDDFYIELRKESDCFLNVKFTSKFFSIEDTIKIGSFEELDISKDQTNLDDYTNYDREHIENCISYIVNQDNFLISLNRKYLNKVSMHEFCSYSCNKENNIDLEILECFNEIIGGEFIEHQSLHYFRPASCIGPLVLPFDLDELILLDQAPFFIKSLFEVWLYLKEGLFSKNFLIIEEPELYLDPVRQRKMARLISQIVNKGCSVFITTNSDTISSEINNLILLNMETACKNKVFEKHGYKDYEKLDYRKIKAYSFQNSVSIEENNVDEFGINVPYIDHNITEMNNVKDDTYFSL